MAENVRTAFL
jgi:hypothetical protein